MSTPLWQFWTDWGIKTLGTLATFIAVFVALFGSRLRHRLTPPRLSIALSSANGAAGTLHVFDPATNKATHQTSGFWHHVRVENKTRADPVTGVHIFLLLIEAPDVASGEFERVWEGDAKLGWRHEPDPEPKKIGYPAECDLCHILKEPLEVRLSPLVRGQVPDRFTQPFKLALTLQARGVEADSRPLRVEISWNGKWSDDRAEMSRHLVVKPV